VKRVGVVGVLLQNLPIEDLRLLQAAGLMVLEGKVDGVWNCRHEYPACLFYFLQHQK
jgi:hypothetical protein